MRIVLADLASADGFVSKDTVVGGYGSRLRPFSRVTGLVCAMKRHLHDLPSVQLGYLAALCAAAGHDVVYTEGTPMDGDVAIVLTSLVELSFPLGAAYTRFYMRPSCLTNYCRWQDRGRRLIGRFDDLVLAWHERSERAAMARGVTC
jgi:hypothetical protein